MLRIARIWPRVMVSVGITLLAGGCTMPVVLESGKPEVELSGFPEGTVAVAATAADGRVLRGVHVVAGEGAPLVLHFLPGRASVTSGVEEHPGFQETLAALREMGLSSLVLDYRGVGASEGPIDAAALAADARAMWQAALERVQDAPGRIIIRAASLGTLPVCTLVAEGIQPAGIVIAAPIDSDSITTRALDFAAGPILGPLLDVFFLEPDIPYLTDTLNQTRTPTLVLLPSTNPFFQTEEAEATVTAVAGNEHVAFARLERDYMDLLLRFYGFDQQSGEGEVVKRLLTEEERFLKEVEEAQ